MEVEKAEALPKVERTRAAAAREKDCIVAVFGNASVCYWILVL